MMDPTEITWGPHGVTHEEKPNAWRHELDRRYVEQAELRAQVYAATHFCYWGWNLLLREYPVSTVAPLSLLIPVFGIAGSIVMLGHHIDRNEGIAIALILAALAAGLIKTHPLLRRTV